MEEHPRQETEEKRKYARSRLRDVAERLIKRHGRPSLGMVLDINTKDIGLRFEDGTGAHLVSILGTVVILNVYKSDDPLGPLTQYRSLRPGEFTRHDVNPQESAPDTTEEAAEKGPMAMMSNMAIGSLGAALEMMSNTQEGLDGNPITAQEARDLTEKLKTARIELF